jgi:hypothetical protein
VRWLFIAAIFMLIFVPVAALARATPEAFLSDILGKAFSGDDLAWLDKVIYEDGLPARVGDSCCSEPREAYESDFDDVIIASDWKIVGKAQESKDHVVITVQFHVLAQTERYRIYPPNDPNGNAADARHIHVLSPGRDEQVSYLLRWRKGTWYLVDPPLPRVEAAAVLKAVRKTKDHYDEQLRTQPMGDVSRILWTTQSRAYQDQIDILEPLVNPAHDGK